jgi:arabinogalactan oligomer/maltooligosaccharide transport system permease protein
MAMVPGWSHDADHRAGVGMNAPAARRIVFAVAWLFLGTAQLHAQPQQKTRLVLWHAYNGTEKTALEQVVQDLNADPAVDYVLDLLGIPYDALVDKITAAVPRQRGPDLFVFGHDTIGDWAEAGILHPLDGHADPTFLRGCYDETVPPLIYRGKLYGLPLAFKSAALLYWKDKITAPPQDTDEMVRLAKQHTNAADGRYGLVYENALLYFHSSWLFGFGGQLFEAATGRVQVDTPQNAASLKFAARLLSEERIVPQEVNTALVQALFGGGKAAMAITGPWVLSSMDRGAPMGVAPLPRVTETGKRARPFMTVEGVFINAKGSHLELAVDAAARVAGLPSARVRLIHGRQPVALRAAWEGLQRQDHPHLYAFRDQLADTVATPNTPAMKSVWSPMDNALNLVLHGAASAEEALREAQQKLDGVLAKVDVPAEEGPFTGFWLLMCALLMGACVWCFKEARETRRNLHLYDGKRTRLAYLYSSPALVALTVLTFCPFTMGIGMGFFRHTYGRWDFVGLANYRDLLTSADTRFFYTLGLTFVWTLSNVFLHVVIGLTLALLLNRPSLRGRAIYRALLIVPWAVPSYITALVWKGMFHPEFGVVNEVFATLGFETRGMSWMADTTTAFLANLATNTWLGFPFMMVVCLGALQSIPADLYEAARIDGATGMFQLRHITLPLLKPALVPAVLLGSVWTFNQFCVVYLVSGGQPDGRTDLLVTEAFRWAFERGPGGAFGLSAAYSTLILIILLGYTVLLGMSTARVNREGAS